MMKKLSVICLLPLVLLISCGEEKRENAVLKPDENGKVELTNEKWEEILPESTYLVMRERGTERPYTGALLKNHAKGVYSCRACGLPLFLSDTKYDSGTGWPSFYQAINNKNVIRETENDGRVEVHCARCEGHLGHVFTDGPKPTGLRYCMNSVALQFAKR